MADEAGLLAQPVPEHNRLQAIFPVYSGLSRDRRTPRVEGETKSTLSLSSRGENDQETEERNGCSY